MREPGALDTAHPSLSRAPSAQSSSFQSGPAQGRVPIVESPASAFKIEIRELVFRSGAIRRPPLI